MSLVADIGRCKRRLIAQTQRLGLVHECFGQREVRQLKDKHDYLGLCWGDASERKQAALLDAFDDWCMNYTGKE